MKRLALIAVLCLLTGLIEATFELDDPSRPDEDAGQDVKVDATMVQGGVLQQAVGDFNAAIGYLAKGNNDKAFDLFQKSALAGHVGAAYYLADMYSDGSGTTQNYAEAYVWASVAAAESGNADADKAAQSRDAYAKFLSLETLNAAQQRADILFRETRAKRTPGKELTN